MINVTKTYLPPFEEYTNILKRAWEKGWITNNGELVLELELKLREFLDVKHLWYTCNGTVVLQMALKALNITGEVITTPFSYVATTNVILWEGCKPIFVDIDPASFCIDVDKIEAAITPNTRAILATHIYGYPCDVEAISVIAKKYSLKVIYDGAHAFGGVYRGKSLLSYGDISTCSFHAAKLFHTGEGGCVIANDAALDRQLMLYRQFGHVYDDYYSMGINGKNSELHAALGLAVLPAMTRMMADLKKTSAIYDAAFSGKLQRPVMPAELQYNYSYYPVVFESEALLLQIVQALKENDIAGRRYFYPSLNELPYLDKQACPVSEDISRRVFCLPLYFEMEEKVVNRVIDVIKSCI